MERQKSSGTLLKQLLYSVYARLSLCLSLFFKVLNTSISSISLQNMVFNMKRFIFYVWKSCGCLVRYTTLTVLSMIFKLGQNDNKQIWFK